MTALIIADDESVLHALPANPADVLISCGDMLDSLILQAAERGNCKQILAVKGNHDSSAPFSPRIFDLHLKTFTFRGVTFGGFCGSWKYKPKGNYLFEQLEVEQQLASFPPVDVFVAHNSPRLVHDREDEVHTGFVAFADYIERAKPRLFLHGHQHVNAETQVGSARVIGVYGHRLLAIAE